MHGTILVFFVLTAGLSGTFANFLNSIAGGCKRYGFAIFKYAYPIGFSLHASVVMFSSLFVQTGPASGGWTIYPPLSALGDASDGSKIGMDLWLVSMAIFIISVIIGWIKLYYYHIEYAYKRNEHDKIAT